MNNLRAEKVNGDYCTYGRGEVVVPGAVVGNHLSSLLTVVDYLRLDKRESDQVEG